jgi:hypothetical protein
MSGGEGSNRERRVAKIETLGPGQTFNQAYVGTLLLTPPKQFVLHCIQHYERMQI